MAAKVYEVYGANGFVTRLNCKRIRYLFTAGSLDANCIAVRYRGWEVSECWSVAELSEGARRSEFVIRYLMNPGNDLSRAVVFDKIKLALKVGNHRHHVVAEVAGMVDPKERSFFPVCICRTFEANAFVKVVTSSFSVEGVASWLNFPSDCRKILKWDSGDSRTSNV